MDNSENDMEWPLVSVVVLNFNGDPVVYYCVDSILRSDYLNFEVIIIDNASTDGSYEKLRERFGSHSNISFHRNERNEGYPGYNRGVHMSKGAYVVFINNDTKVHPDWLKQLVRVMESDPTIGACESKIVDNFIPNTVINPGHCDFCGMMHRDIEKDVGQYSEVREIFSTIGVATTLRRSILKFTGLIDPEFFLFMEINDLCWRIWLSGFRVVNVPDSIIFHIGRIGHAPTYYPLELRILSAYQSTKNHTLMLLKNYSLKSLVKCFPILFALRFGELIILLKTNRRIAMAKLRAYKWLFLKIRSIWASRLRVQHNVRRVSEDAIVRHLIKPNFSYLYHMFSNLIRSYQNSVWKKGSVNDQRMRARKDELLANAQTANARKTNHSDDDQFMNQKVKDFLFFSLIVTLYFAFVYRNLLGFGELIYGDLAPFYPNTSTWLDTYYSSWVNHNLGYPGSAIESSVFMAILQFVLGGSSVWAQKVFFLIVSPISALAMFIFLSYYTSSRFARFAGAFLYAVNPMTIGLYYGGGPGGGMLVQYAGFPLQLLFLLNILNERGNRKVNIICLSLLLAFATGYNPQAIIWFLPFLLTFLVTHLIVKRNQKYAIRTFMSLLASGVLLILLSLPSQTIYFNMIALYFSTPQQAIQLYTSVSIPIESLQQEVLDNYQYLSFGLLNIFMFLTVLSAFLTLFVRKQLKYILSILHVIVSILLFSYLSGTGQIWWLYKALPPLYAISLFKMKMMLFQALYLLVPFFIDEASARGFLDLRLSRRLAFHRFSKPTKVTVSIAIAVILIVSSSAYDLWPGSSSAEYMTGNLDLSRYVIPPVYGNVRRWMDEHLQPGDFFRIFWLPIDPAIESILMRYFYDKPLYYPSFEDRDYVQFIYQYLQYAPHFGWTTGMGRLLAPAGVKYIVVNLAAVEDEFFPMVEHDSPPWLFPWGRQWNPSWYLAGDPKEYARLLDRETNLNVVERNENFVIYENLDFVPFIKAYDRVFFVAPKDMINQTQESQVYTQLIENAETLSNHGVSNMWNAIISPGRVGKLFPSLGMIDGLITTIDFYVRENEGVNSTLYVYLSPEVSVDYVASYNVTIPANQLPDWLSVRINLEWPYDKLFVSWYVSHASTQWGFDSGMPYDDYYSADVSEGNWSIWNDRSWVRVNTWGERVFDWVLKPSPISQWNYEIVLASSTNHLFDQIPGFNGTNLLATTAMLHFNASDENAKQFSSAYNGIILLGDLAETNETAWISEHPTLFFIYEAESTIVPTNGIWEHAEEATFANGLASLVQGEGNGSMTFFVSRDSYYQVALRVMTPEAPSLKIDNGSVDVGEFSISEDGFKWYETDAVFLRKGWHKLWISVVGEQSILDQIVMLSNIQIPMGLEQIASSSKPKIVRMEDKTTRHIVQVEFVEPTFVVMLNSYHSSWDALINGRKLEHYAIPLNMYWANLYYIDSTMLNILEVSHRPQQARNIYIAIWVATWLASILYLVHLSRTKILNFFSKIYHFIEE